MSRDPSRFIFLRQDSLPPNGGRRYLVEDRLDETTQPGGPRNLGHVATVWMGSLIRTGRDRVDPWWIATCLRGHTVEGHSSIPGRPDPTMWQTRNEAAEALLRHVRKADTP